jgi:ribosomal protein S18 acetylase RimI-like enzyme
METDTDTDPLTKPKRQDVKIREMTIDDVADVFHLGERLFEAEKAPNAYRTWDQYEIVALFNSDTEYCLVAEFEDQIVGFALGTTITKRHSAWKYGHLIWLGVVPYFQRLGLAERLFQSFKTLMLKSGVRLLFVDTDAENLPALHFFRKHGFGNPKEHIYLSMNLDTERQRYKKRENHKSDD